MLRVAWLCNLLICLVLPGIDSPQAARQARALEATLRDAGLPVDNAALLEFLRKRTLDEAGIAKINRLLKDLGDRSFGVRETAANELVGLGKPAAPYLRRAERSNDPEVARRAEECLRIINERDGRPGMAGVVARLLASRKPKGASEVLLGYLPFAENEGVVEDVQSALAALAAPDGKPDPALVAALSATLPERRAAASQALATLKDKQIHGKVSGLLKDKDASVRLQTALALLAQNEVAAVPVLVDVLDKLPHGQVLIAEDALWRVAGNSAPATSPGRDAASARRCQAVWQTWWEEHGKSLDLKNRPAAAQPRGYTMVVLLDSGRALELDKQNKVRLKFDGLSYPLDAQMLPGDRLLAAEYHGDRVTERDFDGKIIWEFHIEKPLVAQRLPNGHTFMANEQQFLEVNRQGREIFNVHRPVSDRIMKARKLPNGEIACITTLRRFVRLDTNGTELAGFPVNVGTSGGRIDVLPNGRVLVPERESNRVVEFDASGQIVWQTPFIQPVAAVRLPNGNTLVTAYNDTRAVEIDPDGKEVWHYDAGLRVTRAFRR